MSVNLKDIAAKESARKSNNASQYDGVRYPQKNLLVHVKKIEGDIVHGELMSDAFAHKRGDVVTVSLRPSDNKNRREISGLQKPKGLHKFVFDQESAIADLKNNNPDVEIQYSEDGEVLAVYPGEEEGVPVRGGELEFQKCYNNNNPGDNEGNITANWMEVIISDPRNGKEEALSEIFTMVKPKYENSSFQKATLIMPGTAQRVTSFEEFDNAVANIISNVNIGQQGFLVRSFDPDMDPSDPASRSSFMVTAYALDDSGSPTGKRPETWEEIPERLDAEHERKAERAKENNRNAPPNYWRGTLAKMFGTFEDKSDNRVWIVEEVKDFFIGSETMKKKDMSNRFTLPGRNEGWVKPFFAKSNVGFIVNPETGHASVTHANPEDGNPALLDHNTVLSNDLIPENHREYITNNSPTLYGARNKGNTNDVADENARPSDPEEEASLSL